MSEQSADKIEQCHLCDPAPHENCEVWTFVSIEIPSTNESDAVPVCLEHYEIIEQSLQPESGRSDGGDSQ